MTIGQTLSSDLQGDKISPGLGALVAQTAKPAMQETWVCSLDSEDPLEMDMATHSSTLA